jgi:hypothetical protein
MSSNQLTLKAELTFNVNTVKARGLKPYFEQHGLNTPLFKKAHVVVAAMLEKMCELIVTEAKKHVKRDTSGLHTITRPVLRNAVMLNKELDQYFHMTFKSFESEQMYATQVPVTSKDLKTFVELKFGKNCVFLTAKAWNLLCYLLMVTFLDVTRISNELLTFSDKKTMERNCVRSALRLLLRDTSVCHKVVEEVNRAWDAVVDDKDEEEADNEDEVVEGEVDDDGSDVDADSEHEDDNEKPATKDSKKTATTGKNNKKSTAKAETVDESSDEPNEAEGEADVVVAKPAPSNKKNDGKNDGKKNNGKKNNGKKNNGKNNSA